MKKRFLKIFSVGLLLSSLALSSCNQTSSSTSMPSSVDDSSTTESASTNKPVIRIASTETTVSVGKQIVIRVLVTGTTKRDVSYTSSDATVATVDDRGTVTGLKEGKTIIKATLDADPTVFAEVEITVEPAVPPTSLSIAGDEVRNGWVGEEVTLEVTATPDNADPRVTFSSSDQAIATVDASGTVSFLTKGDVTITATSTAASSVSDSVLFHVGESDYITNYSNYALNFDYTHQGEEDSYIESNAVIEGDNSPAMAWFKTTPSKKYYAEATIEFVNATSDPWTRVGIGSGTEDMDTRAFYFSDKEGQKTVMMDFPNTWGASTARTMIWQVNGIRDLDKTNVRLGVLRNGDDYYYTINGQFYWFEQNDRFTDEDTLPVIVSKDVQCRVREPEVVTDEQTLNSMIASDDFQKIFFESSSNQKNVIYRSDADFEFTNIAETSDMTRLRDQCVKSYGDKGTIGDDFFIEWDISGYQNNSENIHSMVGLALRRYNSDPGIVDSIMVDEQSFHYRTWDYENQFEAVTAGTVKRNSDEFPAAVSSMETAHVRVERRVDKENSKAVFTLFLDGTEYAFEGDELSINYVGDYNILFGANDAKARIMNLTFGTLTEE